MKSLVIEGRHGLRRVKLVDGDEFVEATYDRLSKTRSEATGEHVWVFEHRAEMKASWDRAVTLAEGIVNAPPRVGGYAKR